MTDPLLEIKNLSKSIKRATVIKECNLTLSPGEICVLIGSNGSGKTTLLKTIAGLLFPDDGSIRIMGKILTSKSFEEILPMIGSSISTPNFYNNLTPYMALQLHFELLNITEYSTKDLYHILEQAGLSRSIHRSIGDFSLGMRQRLSLARAYSHKPQLLILDEPTNALDPLAIDYFKSLITEASKNGTSVLISSHDIGVMKYLSDTVAILKDGKIVSKSTAKSFNIDKTIMKSIYGSLGGTNEEYYKN